MHPYDPQALPPMGWRNFVVILVAIFAGAYWLVMRAVRRER